MDRFFLVARAEGRGGMRSKERGEGDLKKVKTASVASA
jgi:hypothetical protein